MLLTKTSEVPRADTEMWPGNDSWTHLRVRTRHLRGLRQQHAGFDEDLGGAACGHGDVARERFLDVQPGDAAEEIAEGAGTGPTNVVWSENGDGDRGLAHVHTGLGGGHRNVLV